MTENNNEPDSPSGLPDFLETKNSNSSETSNTDAAPAPRPAFPGEMPPRPSGSIQGLPASIEMPKSSSGSTSVPNEAVAPDPYRAPTGPSNKSYDDILNEARDVPKGVYNVSGQSPETNPPAPQLPGFEQRPPADNYAPPAAPSAPMYNPGPNVPQYPGNGGQNVNYDQNPSTNVLAIISLVLSIICMGIIAIPLAIAALVQTKKRRQKGKGLAIAAIVISVVEIIIAIVAVFAFASFIGTAIDECESGTPSVEYTDFCEGYNAGSGNSGADDFENFPNDGFPNENFPQDGEFVNP